MMASARDNINNSSLLKVYLQGKVRVANWSPFVFFIYFFIFWLFGIQKSTRFGTIGYFDHLNPQWDRLGVMFLLSSQVQALNCHGLFVSVGLMRRESKIWLRNRIYNAAKVLDKGQISFQRTDLLIQCEKMLKQPPRDNSILLLIKGMHLLKGNNFIYR